MGQKDYSREYYRKNKFKINSKRKERYDSVRKEALNFFLQMSW
jgi:hypothetical protein